jgi:hypothetical protein
MCFSFNSLAWSQVVFISIDSSLYFKAIIRVNKNDPLKKKLGFLGFKFYILSKCASLGF